SGSSKPSAPTAGTSSAPPSPSPACPSSPSLRTAADASGWRNGSDADEEAVAEVALQLRAEDLLRRRVDVVRHALELEHALIRVVHGVAGAIVVVARLPDTADADDVLVPGPQLELLRHHLVHIVVAERE